MASEHKTNAPVWPESPQYSVGKAPGIVVVSCLINESRNIYYYINLRWTCWPMEHAENLFPSCDPLSVITAKYGHGALLRRWYNHLSKGNHGRLFRPC